jgi:hypothetical protein
MHQRNMEGKKGESGLNGKVRAKGKKQKWKGHKT